MKNLLIPTLMVTLMVMSTDAVPGDLLKKLDADEFATRSKAQDDLIKWAKTAKAGDIKELKQVYEKAESPELKLRLLDVLDNSTFMAKPGTRGFVGITMEPKFGGVGILMVQPNTPAQKVDLRIGDIITEVDGRDMTGKKGNVEEATEFFSGYVKGKNAGEKLELKIKRDDKILEKTLKLGDYDAFNRQFLNQQPQLQLQNGKQWQVQPKIRLQMKVAPLGVKPNPKVPPRNAEELRKAVERHQKQAQEKRDALKKRKEELRLKIDELKLKQQK